MRADINVSNITYDQWAAVLKNITGPASIKCDIGDTAAISDSYMYGRPINTSAPGSGGTGAKPVKEEKRKAIEPLSIDHVIFSGPATIVFWGDGTKTVVKCTDGDHYTYDVGIAMATLKKIFGPDYSKYRNTVRKKIKSYENQIAEIEG